MIQSKHSKGKARDALSKEDPTERSDMSMVEVPLGASETNKREVFEEEGYQPRGRKWTRLCIVVLVLVALLGGIIAAVVRSNNQDNLKSYLKGCTKDALICPDGTAVGRDPANHCKFSPCDGQDPASESNTVCPRGIKMCTDMTYVQRTGPNCDFQACPAGSCLVDSKECPDGTFVGPDMDNNCEFEACPGGEDATVNQPSPAEKPLDLSVGAVEEPADTESDQCGREIKFCTDASTVVRSGSDCQFQPCPTGACMVDAQECPDGTYVGRDPANNCEFELCPGESDTEAPSLQEGECPEGINPRETKMCPDLSIITRSGPNCEFETCPP